MFLLCSLCWMRGRVSLGADHIERGVEELGLGFVVRLSRHGKNIPTRWYAVKHEFIVAATGGVQGIVKSKLWRVKIGNKPLCYSGLGFVANFVCGRCGPGTTTLITLPANRIAALDAICSSRATGPCGSYA
jgi:hypothetical protein